MLDLRFVERLHFRVKLESGAAAGAIGLGAAVTLTELTLLANFRVLPEATAAALQQKNFGGTTSRVRSSFSL